MGYDGSDMFALERIRIIRNFLLENRQVEVHALSVMLDVSEVTIRRDLMKLEQDGFLTRTHGGAMLAEDKKLLSPIHSRREENLERKQAIAGQAREFISEGDTIFLDAGSTCLLLAREIKQMNIRVVTNSIDVMMELADAPEINLHTVGGSYRQDAGSFIGPVAEGNIERFQIGTCFTGATGFSARGIFSSQNIIESRFKSAVLAASGRRVMLCDSTKYEKKAFSIFARSGDVDVLISDRDFQAAALFRSLGIEVILA